MTETAKGHAEQVEPDFWLIEHKGRILEAIRPGALAMRRQTYDYAEFTPLYRHGAGAVTDDMLDAAMKVFNESAYAYPTWRDHVRAMIKAARLAALRPDEAAGLTDHKWLDPECGANGCQSLVWRARYEAAVNGRREFRAAYRAARHAYVPDPEHPQFCKQCGYAEHVELQHAAPDEAAGQGETIKEAGAKLAKAVFGVSLATPRPEASDAPDTSRTALQSTRPSVGKPSTTA